MNSVLEDSIFFGLTLSFLSYFLGDFLQKKFKSQIFNPLLISIVISISVLTIFNIDYDSYYNGAKYISYLLTPATVALAIPLYEQLNTLKKNYKAIIAGILSGVLTSLSFVLVMALIFNFSHAEYVTFLPKSISTAIGMDVSSELGGYVSVTVAIIVITGIIGNVAGSGILKIFRITSPIAKGIALGTSSHAMGTAKAMELGEVEGAISSLSIVVAGIITVIGASIFAGFM
ncbi:MAG: LrgB family protein [Clostridiales bacterium]|nr:LrgB family protein [Clostridiales bacterium]